MYMDAVIEKNLHPYVRIKVNFVPILNKDLSYGSETHLMRQDAVNLKVLQSCRPGHALTHSWASQNKVVKDRVRL